MKYLVAITVMVFILIQSAAGVQLNDDAGDAENEFIADIYCPYGLYPDGNTTFLGVMFADGNPVYNIPAYLGDGDRLKFTLEGQRYDVGAGDPNYDQATYTVECTQMQTSCFGGRARIKAYWKVTDLLGTREYTTTNGYAVNYQFQGTDEDDVQLMNGNHPCEATATFEVIVYEMVADTDCPPGVCSFNMTLSADLNNI